MNKDLQIRNSGNVVSVEFYINRRPDGSQDRPGPSEGRQPPKPQPDFGCGAAAGSPDLIAQEAVRKSFEAINKLGDAKTLAHS